MNQNTETKTQKRRYTRRNSTVPVTRHVILDGVEVGRGRPAKEKRGQRRVVYLPKGVTYNPLVHGNGQPYRASKHGVLRRLKVEIAKNLVVPVAPVETPVAPVVENATETPVTEPVAVGNTSELVNA